MATGASHQLPKVKHILFRADSLSQTPKNKQIDIYHVGFNPPQ
jgi:hypothetical protein